MIDPSPTRRSTFALLAGLYVSQFPGVGFFVTGLTAILRERGTALEQLGVVQALGMPTRVAGPDAVMADLVDCTGHVGGTQPRPRVAPSQKIVG